MDIDNSWAELVLRLFASLGAGAILGFNRGYHGRPAGLRTTTLVCLTAAASLVLANIILGTVGRSSDSFATMDVMRLPLGVLTGVGFIGAGAILRKGNLVLGVTTAATLWFATMLGFCFGAGEFQLGGILLGLGVAILWGFDWLEGHLSTKHTAVLTLRARHGGVTEDQVVDLLRRENYSASVLTTRLDRESIRYVFVVSWQSSEGSPTFLSYLNSQPSVEGVKWDSSGRSGNF